MVNGFKVGDIVQIKEWDEMKKEFGVTNEGMIGSRYPFTKDMRFLCNQIFQINHFTETIFGDIFIRFEDTDKPYGFLINQFAISMDVIRCIKLENG